MSRLSSSDQDSPFSLTRVFPAPRDLIYRAWTEPQRLQHWWGPKGLGLQVYEMDLRPGGSFLYGMSAPEGPEMFGKFVYQEIQAPERLVFINSFCDRQGNLQRHPLSPTWPLETRNTLTLVEANGQTTLTLQGGPFQANEEETNTFLTNLASLSAGMGGTLSQLDAYLAEVGTGA